MYHLHVIIISSLWFHPVGLAVNRQPRCRPGDCRAVWKKNAGFLRTRRQLRVEKELLIPLRVCKNFFLLLRQVIAELLTACK